jgi:hypothetical protein
VADPTGNNSLLKTRSLYRKQTATLLLIPGAAVIFRNVAEHGARQCHKLFGNSKKELFFRRNVYCHMNSDVSAYHSDACFD